MSRFQSLLCFSFFLVLVGCSTSDSPHTYYQTLSQTHQQAIDSYNAYTEFADQKDLEEGIFEKMEEKRQQTLDQISVLRDKIRGVTELKDDEGLKVAYLNDFDVMLDLLSHEEKELITLWKGSTLPSPTQEEVDHEAELLRSIEEKNQASYTQIEIAEKAYKTQYQIE